MDGVIIVRFKTATAAVPVETRLFESGITVTMLGPRDRAGGGSFLRGHGMFSVWVPYEERESVEAMFVEWQEHDGALSEALCCPECRSLEIEYPQLSRHDSGLWVWIERALRQFGILRPQFHCPECRKTWAEPVKLGRNRLNPQHSNGCPTGVESIQLREVCRNSRVQVVRGRCAARTAGRY